MYLQKVISRKTVQKNCFFVNVLKTNYENSRIGSGSISQRHGSPDSDPYKNVTDPQHCQEESQTGYQGESRLSVNGETGDIMTKKSVQWRCYINFTE